MFTYVDTYVYINAYMCNLPVPIDEMNAALKITINKFTHLHICVYMEVNMCNLPICLYMRRMLL
jgi:hypothetical protein